MNKKEQHALSGIFAVIAGFMLFSGLFLGSIMSDSVIDDSEYSLTYNIKTISSDAKVVFGESTVKGIGQDEMSFKAEDYSVGDKVRVYFDEDGEVIRKMEVD